MSEETTIILCGGSINYIDLPIGTNISNAMIPVNGKPVIGWILDNLLEKDIQQATVVLRQQDHRLQSFLQRAYTNRMDLSIAQLSQPGSIIQSLHAGLRCSPVDGLVRIMLGDTLITDSFMDQKDFVYVGRVQDSRRWCLAVTNEQHTVIDYIDKQVNAPSPHQALVGYYHLLYGDLLHDCVRDAIESDERELSDVLRRYGRLYPIFAQPVENWYDFGNIDNLVDARRRLLRTRYFNSLSINPVLNTITKISKDDQKLHNELNWYLNLPDELKVLSPRILKKGVENGHLEIVQEYYGYPTLAELYVFGDLHTDTWLSILRQVLRIHQEFRRYPGQLEVKYIRAIFADKTWERLATLREQDEHWKDLLDQDEIMYNGCRLRSVPLLVPAIDAWAQALAASAPISIIHGDFCFSNILFDLNNQIIRLIDPRGSFGLPGIYGDARYDIAKLRHSVCGLYDFIQADMFELSETSDGFIGQIYSNNVHRQVANEFDHMISKAGYDLNEIQFIEGLLFLSMLPIHIDKPRRQHFMFFTALSLLNEVL